MPVRALRARLRRRHLPKDNRNRSRTGIAPNKLEHQVGLPQPAVSKTGMSSIEMGKMPSWARCNDFPFIFFNLRALLALPMSR